MTAVCLWKLGYAEKKVNWRYYEGREERITDLFGGIIVKRNLIPDLLDDFFYDCVGLYIKFKRYGLPFIGGWANQPAVVIDILDMFEYVINVIDAEQAKERIKR